MQPPISETLTIRQEDGVTAVEMTTASALVTATPETLSVMTRRRLHVITWSDLIEMLDDLHAEYDNDERVQVITIPSPEEIIEANRRALRAWLTSRPGVVMGNRNGHNGHQV